MRHLWEMHAFAKFGPMPEDHGQNLFAITVWSIVSFLSVLKVLFRLDFFGVPLKEGDEKELKKSLENRRVCAWLVK